MSSAIRRRSSSSATIVTAWCSVRRSNSDSAPSSLAATSHACGAPSSPPVARATGSASARPSSSPPGANPRRAPARARSRSSAPSSATTCGSTPEEASSSPRPSNTSAGPPISADSAPATPSSPCSESTIRSSRSWAASARRSTAYCSLTRCVNAFSVSAMNGSSYGTSNSAKSCFAAASTSASGIVSCAKPVPRPSPASPWPASRATYARCVSGSVSAMPVVSSSSPPDRNGVGSSSSEMCTQRTARVEPLATGGEAHVEVGEEVAEGQHRQTGGSGSPICTKRTGY